MSRTSAFTCHPDGAACSCTKGKALCSVGRGEPHNTALYHVGSGKPKAAAKSTNPKKAMGMAKPPMHLVPASAMVHLAMSFKDGAAKYGPYNWREDPVDATTYVAAAKRHLDLWFNGQDMTSDSKVHNLGAVMACCAIILDALAQGNLIDDRPPAQDLEALMDQFTVGKGIAA